MHVAPGWPAGEKTTTSRSMIPCANRMGDHINARRWQPSSGASNALARDRGTRAKERLPEAPSCQQSLSEEKNKNSAKHCYHELTASRNYGCPRYPPTTAILHSNHDSTSDGSRAISISNTAPPSQGVPVRSSEERVHAKIMPLGMPCIARSSWEPMSYVGMIGDGGRCRVARGWVLATMARGRKG
ncbi:hypothetical protein FA95DRAFT_1558072 [Auriscalpium vulgare]|uniref:Uncharacterized protein n=1 Tax=Auriscalpium vulgare TaxID=40419 RepID=A0ACB8RW59_9AGAM|nr:hypothetical protein FA95DRAFT_1558072 [Auriscalpium vulgare]